MKEVVQYNSAVTVGRDAYLLSSWIRESTGELIYRTTRSSIMDTFVFTLFHYKELHKAKQTVLADTCIYNMVSPDGKKYMLVMTKFVAEGELLQVRYWVKATREEFCHMNSCTAKIENKLIRIAKVAFSRYVNSASRTLKELTIGPGTVHTVEKDIEFQVRVSMEEFATTQFSQPFSLNGGV